MAAAAAIPVKSIRMIFEKQVNLHKSAFFMPPKIEKEAGAF
jgi:hypothetical protein